MPAVDLPTGSSFVNAHAKELTALASVIVAVVLAKLVDRALSRRSVKLAQSVTGRELSPGADTRLRLIRRLIFVDDHRDRESRSRCFSSRRSSAWPPGCSRRRRCSASIVGFAARQTLANGVAGILLAITQPIRVGDLVTFQGETGTVEDVRLTYTHVRLDDGRRLIIPNEQLASSTIINHTIVDPRVRVEVSIWLPLDADVGSRRSRSSPRSRRRRLRWLRSTPEGIRLNIATWAASAPERGAAAAGLRARCIERLHQASILGG